MPPLVGGRGRRISVGQSGLHSELLIILNKIAYATSWLPHRYLKESRRIPRTRQHKTSRCPAMAGYHVTSPSRPSQESQRRPSLRGRRPCLLTSTPLHEEAKDGNSSSLRYLPRPKTTLLVTSLTRDSQAKLHWPLLPPRFDGNSLKADTVSEDSVSEDERKEVI